MWEKFGVGAVIIILAALYFIVRQAVKDGIKEAYKDITGKKIDEDMETEKVCKELFEEDNK